MNKWEILKKLYIDNGLKIFPVEKNGKKPLIEKWQEECSSDFFQILYWYENCKGCNWGLPATPNNLFILDLDVHNENKNGIGSFNKIIELLYTDENGTYDDAYDVFAENYMEQVTPSGGKHIIYRSDDDLKNVSNGSNVFKDYPGIDIRTDGYIVVEPSEINGKNYKFSTIMNISKMPRKLKKFILENASAKNNEEKKPYEKPTNVEVGDRDNQLFLYINNIYQKTKLDYDEILCLANNFNETVLEKPLPKRDVTYKVKKCFEKDRNKYIFIKLNDE